MSDLFWPGDDRAGAHLSSEQLLAAMLRVEEAWLDVLVEHGVAPRVARSPLHVPLGRLPDLVVAAEQAGNPVTAMLRMIRADLDTPAETVRWLHRGLSSQDVVDTALMWLLGTAARDVRLALEQQVVTLVELALDHRDTPVVARTLTQHAVPTTFGLKVASWLSGVLDAYEDVDALVFPVQVGGAAGTMAAAVELGLDPYVARAGLASRLGLSDAPSWHTTRSAVTRVGDALVRCTDAWGRIANDVLTWSRPEIGEVGEGTGGGSSTMPHKANPVLSTLVRRAALTTPQLAATLHLAAAEQVDERADGGWHAEWAPLRDLARRTLVAGSQTTDLLAGLVVHPARMASTLERARADVHAEQRSMAGVAGHEPSGDYLGIAGGLVDDVVSRARATLEETR
ncbi:MAG: 3-carboxy-cis,cis-muconate cycloisomerase [Nocardioides sp.]|nr:3-carboxy-cis,cis-muconate cycloisomerase [Nocardioides sp.]